MTPPAEPVPSPRSRLGDTEQTRAFILREAEALLRRHGPAKLTVTDIAGRCGMSHSNLYRFFPGKAAIYGALAAHWFGDVEAALERIADEPGDPARRLEAYVLTLLRLKREKALEDRELYAAYLEAAADCRDIVAAHVRQLGACLRRIVSDAAADAAFAIPDTDAAATAIELATWRFRHPRLILEHLDEPAEAQARAVVRLLVRGLRR